MSRAVFVLNGPNLNMLVAASRKFTAQRPCSRFSKAVSSLQTSWIWFASFVKRTAKR